MKKILILVEGQTEERFIKNILSPFLEPRGVHLQAVIVSTKVVRGGPKQKGGWVSYAKAKRDLQKLLQDTNASAVTTMFDFYGIPEDFPKWDRENHASCYDKVISAEKAFADDIQQERFVPYLQLHEFEGLLFSSPDTISDVFVGNKKKELNFIRSNFKTPEEINEGVETHPSKRLLKLFPSYRKPLHGSIIADRTGLETIRRHCPHFSKWVEILLKN